MGECCRGSRQAIQQIWPEAGQCSVHPLPFKGAPSVRLVIMLTVALPSCVSRHIIWPLQQYIPHGTFEQRCEVVLTRR